MTLEMWLHYLLTKLNYSIIRNVIIIGVPHLDKYKACLQCKARVEPLNTPLCRCSKVDCMMMQRYDLCGKHTTAKF